MQYFARLIDSTNSFCLSGYLIALLLIVLLENSNLNLMTVGFYPLDVRCSPVIKNSFLKFFIIVKFLANLELPRSVAIFAGRYGGFASWNEREAADVFDNHLLCSDPALMKSRRANYNSSFVRTTVGVPM